VRAAAALLCSFAACTTDVAPSDLCDGSEADASFSSLRLGVESGGAFVPIESGETLELVLGAQGGWMILPSLEAESDGAADPLCVSLEAEVSGHPEPIAQRMRVRFEPSNGALYGGPFQFFLSFDVFALDGRSALLTARIGSAAETSVEIVLANRE
jgi:hypothetical protein